MEQQDNRDFSQQWDELLKDAFGGTEAPADTDAEPVKEKPAETTSAPDEPAELTPVPDTPAKRPLYRRFWFWLILIALAAGLGIAAWFFFGKETDTEPPDPYDEFMQEAIAQCKTALAQWQAMDSYCMTQSNLYYGDSLGGATWGAIWGAGDDILKMHYLFFNEYVDGTLKHGDEIYSRFTSIHQETGILEKNYWSHPEENEQVSTTPPWPMGFDWDTSQIKGISAARSTDSRGNSHFTSVSFAVLSGDSTDPTMYPCHVNFTFDTNSNLQSVTLIDVDPGEAAGTGICVVTYRLSATDYDIAQFIADARYEPLTFVLSNLPPQPDSETNKTAP